MSIKITTQFGHAVPPAPRHAVTVHMPGWQTVEKYSVDAQSIIKTFHNAYPRAKPHRDIATVRMPTFHQTIISPVGFADFSRQLSSAVLRHLGLSGHYAFLFGSLQSARECVRFATSPQRDDGKDKDHIPSDIVTIRAFKAEDYVWAVIFPEDHYYLVRGFWARPGCGISSRFAEANLPYCEQFTEVDASSEDHLRKGFEGGEHQALRERIVYHVNRATERPTSLNPTPEDVYLFPSGMSTIYKPHTYFSSLYNGKTVLFGMAFMDTVVALQEYGAGFKFLGLGSDSDLAELETYLHDQRSERQKIQAIWAEFPANPILVTPDLVRLRALADAHDVLLCIDDTIASFANIDILHMTDILTTSLTKSFNGYADVIAGSVILNPNGRHYTELKSLFARRYTPELHVADVRTILRNNTDYLARTITLNANAASIVSYLKVCAKDPDSAIKAVHYPTTLPSCKNYTKFLRKSTPEFPAPGYGCLFSVELRDLPSTIAFYDNLNVHKSVHLGAPFTLAFAYTMCTYGQSLEWAEQYGLKATQIRITAGLEDIHVLLEDFRVAVEAADRIMAEQRLNERMGGRSETHRSRDVWQ